MFKKLLIANRGEVAVRTIRAACESGINMVAVYSEADKDSLHTVLVDEAICIDPARSTDSYLNVDVVLSATIVTRAQTIYPGFGFLSENSEFATVCEEICIKFIGPSVEIMDKMGDKVSARAEMIAVDVPVIPGSDGEAFIAEKAFEVADRLGYPIMLKTSAGSGGEGTRKVESAEELVPAFESASQGALAAFDSGAVYIEEVIRPARHIEVQILGDSHDDVVRLGKRDYFLQRNNQKILEESPSVAINKTLCAQIGDTATCTAKAVHYENAGTVELLFDEETSELYLMKMNIRAQVEYPVTESITGIDTVKEQTRIAAGQSLSVTRDDITITDHATGYHINAENPEFNFASSPGRVTDLCSPSGGVGLRIDSTVYGGHSIPPYYDSMIAKITIHGENRFDALMKIQRVLYKLEIEGVTTNAEFQMDLISDRHVVAGDYGTSFLMEIFLPDYNKEND